MELNDLAPAIARAQRPAPAGGYDDAEEFDDQTV
jgi:hypothetical protein